jgi:hypothetical protein
MSARFSAARIEQIIREWQAAFAEANQRTAPPVIWEKGWFTIGDERQSKYRRWQLERMTQNLREEN